MEKQKRRNGRIRFAGKMRYGGVGLGKNHGDGCGESGDMERVWESGIRSHGRIWAGIGC